MEQNQSNNGAGDKTPKTFRTRKSDIISLFSVGTLIAIIVFAYGVVKDLRASIEAQTRDINARIVQETTQLKIDISNLLAIDRTRSEKDIQKLESRVTYLERKENKIAE